MIWAILTSGITLVIGGIIYFALPNIWQRVFVVLLFVTQVLAQYMLVFETMGLPKPYALEWRDIKGEEIVGLQWAEKSVYAWVNIDGVPRGYEFPMPKDAKETEELQGKYEGRSRSGAQFYVSGEGDVADVEMPPPAPVKDGSPTMEIPE